MRHLRIILKRESEDDDSTFAAEGSTDLALVPFESSQQLSEGPRDG